MTTLAQYRTAVSSKLGLDNSTAGDQTLIDSWINEGLADLMMRTSCQVRTATMPLVAGVGNYALDTAILKLIDMYVSVNATAYALKQVSIEEITAMRLASTTYTSPAQYYAVLGSDMFAIYPTPATSDSVIVYYVPRPTVLSVSSDTPDEIPLEFQKAIEFYALSEGADLSDDQGSQMGMFYLNKYEQWVKRLKRWTNMKGNHRMPRATIGASEMRFPFHDRSTYPQ